ncbi:ROK family protein [Pseudoxanthomonas mexicana]|uniref:ROK family protein n=1 Tax=Pseudoxanthomonas mexicana TaxID=128785 RepID=UPI00398A5786
MAKPSSSRHAGDDRGRHGATRLPGLSIDNYNLAIADPEGDGFLGDRASQTAFRTLLDTARREQRTGKDPFGKSPARELGKKEMDLVLVGGDPDAAHLMHLVIEEYARRLVHVLQCFLAQPEWEGVERVVLGGGFPDSEIGGLAIRRAMRLLKIARVDLDLHVLRHDSDEGGLLGWLPLLPRQAHRRHDAFLAVDVGGTNLRCGIVEHRLADDAEGGKARVIERLQWRHADDEPNRGEAIARLAAMLNGLIAQARTLGIRLAPFVGVACPGRIEEDGGIPQGAQNLPGDWEIPFNLPRELTRRLDPVGGRIPLVVMHNDAVVQGLSERLRMRKARRWGVLTIGTGLGNASYTRR